MDEWYDGLKEDVIKIERRQNRTVAGSKKWIKLEKSRLEAVIEMNLTLCLMGDQLLPPGQYTGFTSKDGTTITIKSSDAEHLKYALECPRFLPVNTPKSQSRSSKSKGCLFVLILVFVLSMLFAYLIG